MDNSNNKGILIAGLIGISLFWGCGGQPGTPLTNTKKEQQGRLPQDVLAPCTVAPDTFNTWFAGGKAAENGKVVAANSVSFPSVNNCSFYTWSEQMFLWLVSPDKNDKYTPNNTVLESPLFYDAVTTDASGDMALIQHEPGKKLINVTGMIKEIGPDGLLLVTDDKGEEFEVEAPKPKSKGNVLAMTARGIVQNTEVASIEPGTDTLHHIFKDRMGKVIEHPKAHPLHKRHQERILQEIKTQHADVFIDTAGNEHAILIGQATGHVLMATQNNSLIYYAIMVNDVYAFYLTAFKENKPFTRDSLFPTTAAARDSICAFARKRGITLPDSNALAMELKLSLVEVTGLKNPETYITIDANVPIYDTSNKNNWIPTGKTRVAKLAIAGIHVVGSVAGHPEMSWATFEHKNNAPNGAYDYLTSKGDTVHMAADTGSGWLLCNSSGDQPYNKPHMKNNNDTIASISPFTVSASSTNLVFPFGSMIGEITNPENRCSAASNSEVIGINNSIINQLVGNDLRKNYIMIGATWTSHGANPTGASFSLKDSTPGVAIGTNMLANSTMETYIQKPGKSCFTCHNGPNLSPENEDGLSHIFSFISPLPAMPTPPKK